MKTSSKKWQKIRKIKGLRQFVTWYPRHVSENPGCMGLNERIAELEAENVKLKQENDQLLDIVVQMRSTLNRLIARYISSDSQEG